MEVARRKGNKCRTLYQPSDLEGCWFSGKSTSQTSVTHIMREREREIPEEMK